MPIVTATRWLVVTRPEASPLWLSGTPEVAVTVAATTAVMCPKKPMKSAGISSQESSTERQAGSGAR